jgi:hypothetical protein
MFVLEQPSMALNDTRLNVKVSMKISRTVTPNESISSILGAVVKEAKAQPGGRLKNLVFNCHGNPGELIMGCGVINNLTDRFKMLAPDDKPLVERIYLRSCEVARIVNPGSGTDGNLFCSAIAKYARCIVIASTSVQSTWYGGETLPYGCLDEFEGTELHYGPKGNVLSVLANRPSGPWTTED